MAQQAWRTTVGKKIIMGVSGLLLILFLIEHLAGNLALFIPDGGAFFNRYTEFLEQFGVLTNIIELALAAVFLFHIVSGILVYRKNRSARKHRYAVEGSKGGPSRMSTSSRSMIVTGIVLLIFIPVHIIMFKYGTYYETVVHGESMRDLYRLVVEQFKNPIIAFGYAGVMLLLGMHLRHGFWSALQSLSAMSPRWSPVVYTSGLIVAILLAGGFFVLPLYVFFAV